MIGECSITCGSWGAGLAAFDRLFSMLPEIIFALAFIGAVWFIASVRS